ncbi:hypothetical protein BAE44_0007425 [Dichanthelium oligosanthes]|uniref:F-box/kelch-repeat protein n=1 Tax=Dichanthelium oligosanthes TaxID=888268 RepID=A0A1E5W2J0_9POAL|nr:hypothetical protein BAE44_0007425 [Dichanthelium oligosanthes]
MKWSLASLPSPPFNGRDIVAYASHPDGHTIFMSTTRDCTHCFDTSEGVWRELGDWVLPFQGQAYFDGELDAWVGLHRRNEGYICCCPVPSRSAVAAQPPECKILKEKLFRKEEGVPSHRQLRTTINYIGGFASSRA